ncbi:MAG: T9SS type A sorting domain-containing protein [Bacteroidetes bacterium]|nr:T9SS type A sorting domain-containing protein [Bacteroidota bacterium]
MIRYFIQKPLFLILIILTGIQVFSQHHEYRYSFFTAGHTYGSPSNVQFGLHQPFVEQIPFLNAYPGMGLAFLTGDVVAVSNAQYWDSAQVNIDSMNMPVYIAAGNHDMGDEFLLRFGPYYSCFKHDSDLFVILTPGLDNWNITGSQKEFLVSTLDSFAPQSRYVFIMLHELIWWSPDSIFRNVTINYIGHYPGSTNFWNEIEPILNALPNKVVMYAGDLGCTDFVSPFMYYAYDNITLIASGMGGGVRDNIIITDVCIDTLIFDLYALNGDDPDKLGELTDFSLFPPGFQDFAEDDLLIFPNPVRGVVNLQIPDELKGDKDLVLSIHDMMGKFVQKEKVENVHGILRIDIQAQAKGLYHVALSNGRKVYSGKIVFE